ncbi:MAG: hypothetical protein ACRDSR_01400 [Pseudonocardiaceae bacterium]
MIVLEGTPGAGKTTRLGALLAEHPDALIFPEAQPPPGAEHPADLEALLAEDHHRTRHAAEVHACSPATVVASDRCHLGVLAYRHALVATGRAPRAVFDQARAWAEQLGLDARHHHDEIHISLLDPYQSRRRRVRFSGDPRYQTWFDLEFLAAYNDFFSHLDLWSTTGPRWTVTLLPDHNPPHRALAAALRCPLACDDAQSPIITHGQLQRQLYTDALYHRATPDAPVTCQRSAQQIAAAWHATLGHNPTRQHSR